jgi:hypothetical protein
MPVISSSVVYRTARVAPGLYPKNTHCFEGDHQKNQVQGSAEDISGKVQEEAGIWLGIKNTERKEPAKRSERPKRSTHDAIKLTQQ